MLSYANWLKSVPQDIQQDGLWRMEIYRKALFLFDIAWHDCDKLIHHATLQPCNFFSYEIR